MILARKWIGLENMLSKVKQTQRQTLHVVSHNTDPSLWFYICIETHL